MKGKKKLLTLLALTASCCFILGATSCKGGDGSSNSGSGVTMEVGLTNSDVVLKVGDTYKLTTTDGVIYGNYSSDAPNVCAVTETGVLIAKSVGTANVKVTTATGELTCKVTVLPQGANASNYYVMLTSIKTLKIGDELTVKADVFHNNAKSDEAVTWTVEGDGATYVNEGNLLYLTGAQKGEVKVKASIGGFETSVKVKVYGATDPLPAPEVSFGVASISWNSVEGAKGYSVSVDRGATWTETTQTSLATNGILNPLHVIVVALADESSENVDSEYSLFKRDVDIETVQEACLEEYEETGDGLSFAGKGSAQYRLFNVYGCEKSLYNNGGDAELFGDTAIVLDAKKVGMEAEITFVTQSEDGLQTLSSFTLNDELQTIGYLLNGFGYNAYVMATGGVEIENVRLQYQPNEFAYSSIYLNMLESLEDTTASSNMQYIMDNLQYLNDEEHARIFEELSPEIQARLYDVKFLSETVSVDELSENNAQNDVSFSITYDRKYVDRANGNNSAILVTGGSVNHSEVLYGALLPENDPGFDFYELRIYTPIAFNYVPGTTSGLLIAGRHVSTVAGWNTIVCTWNQLIYNNGRGLIYNEELRGFNTVWYAIGGITGKYLESDVTILGKTVTPEDFAELNEENDINFSVSNEALYVDSANGNTTAILISGGNVQYSDIFYGDLLPAVDPGYDYYAIRLWSSRDFTREDNRGGLLFGRGHVNVKAGWNTIYRTWDELTYQAMNAKDTLIYPEEPMSPGQVWFALGNITGKYNMESDVTAFGEKVYAHQFVGENLVMRMSDGAYVDSAKGNKTTILVNATTNSSSISYSAIMPESNPGYEYYEWRIYAKTMVTVQIGDKKTTLQTGWNTVTLTWIQLYSTGVAGQTITNISVLPSNSVWFAFGNLVGKNT